MAIHSTGPNWKDGQRCKPYFIHRGQGIVRFILTLLGIVLALSVPMTTLITNLSAAPPPVGVGPIVAAWGIAYLLVAIGSLILTLHTEAELWGCLVAGIGTPTLLVVIMTALLPHL